MSVLFSIFLIVSLVIQIRSFIVFRARIYVIKNDWASYRGLPPYEKMLFGYWTIWTPSKFVTLAKTRAMFLPEAGSNVS